MPSQDYNFDPTGVNPDNRVNNEVHAIDGSIAVIPFHGAFYREGLVVEASLIMGGNTITEILRRDADYVFSPLYVRPSAVSGKDAYSYILLRGEWDSVKLTYQAVGGMYGTDTDLLTKVANAVIDRTNITAWLTITGSDSYHPSSRNPIEQKVSEIEVMNSGLGRIYEAIEKLVPGQGEKATNQQVTALEVRQTELTTRQDTVTTRFDGIQSDFTDIRELFGYLEDLVLRGDRANVAENGGYIYRSNGALLEHNIAHNLNAPHVDVTVWVFDGVNKLYRHSTLVECVMVDENNVLIRNTVPDELLVIVRPVSVANGGFIYESTVPALTHIVDHNLNTGFVSANVWVEQPNGEWVWAVLPIRLINNNRALVELDEARNIKAVIQRPLPNAFIFKSGSAEITHRVVHDLYSPFVGVSVWEKNVDGTYRTGLLSTSMIASSALDVVLDEPKVIKVVVQPALISSVSFEQDMTQKHTLLEDRMDQVQSLFYSLETLINDIESSGTGIINRGVTYESPAPTMTHTVTHGLNDDAVDVVLWVEHEDGLYYKDDAKISMLDNNTIAVSLVEAASIRVRISKI